MAGHVPPQCHTRRLLTGAIPGPAQERSPGQEEPCQPLFPSGASSQVTRCGACLAGSWLLRRRGLELCPRSSRLGGSRARGPSSRQAEQTPHPRRLARPPPKRRVPPGSSRLALLPPDEDVPHFQLSAPRRCHPNARPPKPSDGHTWNEAAVSSDHFFKKPCTTWPLLKRTDNPCTPNTSHTFSSLDVGHPRGQEPLRERGTPPRPQDAATSRAGTHGRGQARPARRACAARAAVTSSLLLRTQLSRQLCRSRPRASLTAKPGM